MQRRAVEVMHWKQEADWLWVINFSLNKKFNYCIAVKRAEGQSIHFLITFYNGKCAQSSDGGGHALGSLLLLTLQIGWRIFSPSGWSTPRRSTHMWILLHCYFIGYYCHTCYMELIQIAQEICIKIVSLPTYSTCKLKTHDKNVHGPSECIIQWENLDMDSPQWSSSGCTAVNCFQATGIYALTKIAFYDANTTAAEAVLVKICNVKVW
jgi:hypothetical protein